MKSVRISKLAVLTMVAFVSVGVSSAAAENTALCNAEESSCSAANQVKHVHETSVGKAKFKSSLPTIECNVLFLGDAIKPLGSPLVVEGSFTYSSCNNFCTVTESTELPSARLILKFATERADVWTEIEIHVICPYINCYYSEELNLFGAAARGPLAAFLNENGEITVNEEELFITKNKWCPFSMFLTLTTTPLSAAYISS